MYTSDFIYNIKTWSNPRSCIYCAFAYCMYCTICTPMGDSSYDKIVIKILLSASYNKNRISIFLSIILPFMLYKLLSITWWSFILICCTCVCCTIFSIYTVGLNKEERMFIQQKVQSFRKKI